MPAKKMAKKASTKKSAMKKGSKFACQECGIVVKVDELCGCVDTCDLICCGTPMKPARAC